MRCNHFPHALRPKVLVLDSLQGVQTTLQVVQCLVAAGIFEIAVASPHRNSILKYSRWVKNFYFLESPSNSQSTLPNLKAILRKNGYDILLPVNVDQIDFLTWHADNELRSLVRITEQPTAEFFRIANSKSQLSMFMEQHEIPHPKTVRFNAADPSMPSCLEALRIPVITKREWGGGGREMRIFEQRDGLLAYLQDSSTPQNPQIVQEFIQGHDLGVAVFCRSGEVLYKTMQRNMSADQETLQPSKALQFFDNPEAGMIASKLMRSLNWSGIAQIDLRQDSASGALYVLEINPRFWGSVLGSQRMGVNFPEIACRMAAGLPLRPVEYRKGKYITALGYMLEWWDRLFGKGSMETFTYSDSAFGEIVKDPMPRILQALYRIVKRVT